MKSIIFALLINFIFIEFGFAGIFVKNVVKTNPGKNMYDTEPCWFENGWSILFTRIDEESGRGGIWMMDIFGGEQPITLLNQRNYTFRKPIATPGGRIVVERAGERCDLLITEMDGREIQKVNEEGEIAFHPVWSPDGGELVFCTLKESPLLRFWDRLMGGENRIWLLEIGGRKHLLHRFHTYSALFPPSFSPDGEKVIFSLDEFYLVRLKSGEKVKLTHFNGFAPIWLPNGERIAFLTKKDGRFDVFTMKEDGGEKKRVVEEIYFPFISFSQDGERVLYSDKRGGVYSLLVVGVDGGGESVLLQSREKIFHHPIWSPKGDRVAVEVDFLKGGSEIWILELDL
jgi:Tol biopolymer transport system component